MKDESKGTNIYNFMAAFCLFALFGAAGAFAQTPALAKNEPAKAAAQEAAQSAASMPALTEYKGVKIGMTADEVRSKINEKPKVADKDGFYYEISDAETVQIMLDDEKKVRVIVVMYADKNGTAPKYADVFGKDVPLNEMPDGRVYNLIRYPDAGYWVAYNRTAGNNPMVTVTIQKF